MNETLEGEYEKIYATPDWAGSQAVNTMSAAASIVGAHMDIGLYTFIILYYTCTVCTYILSTHKLKKHHCQVHTTR